MAAGGMGGRGGIPMSDRVRATSARSRASYDEGPARHCWVADAVDGLGVKRPGLLVEWRQAGTVWQGRVVYAAQPHPGRWVLVEEWVDAALLTPL
jgi:hypothetical protein